MAPPRGRGWRCSPEAPPCWGPSQLSAVLWFPFLCLLSFKNLLLNFIFRFVLSFSFLVSCNFQVSSILFISWNHFLSSQTINDGFGVGLFILAFIFLRDFFLPRPSLSVLTSVSGFSM